MVRLAPPPARPPRPGPAPALRRVVGVARLMLVCLTAALAVMAVAAYLQLSQAQERRPGAAGAAAGAALGEAARQR